MLKKCSVFLLTIHTINTGPDKSGTIDLEIRMPDLQQAAQRALQLMDLTTLNDNDTDAIGGLHCAGRQKQLQG